VVELDLDGVGRLAAVGIGQRHVGGDAGGADRAVGGLLAKLLVERDQQVGDVRLLAGGRRHGLDLPIRRHHRGVRVELTLPAQHLLRRRQQEVQELLDLLLGLGHVVRLPGIRPGQPPGQSVLTASNSPVSTSRSTSREI
jgi:hypothetical protein